MGSVPTTVHEATASDKQYQNDSHNEENYEDGG